jgi:hypothetical protein
MSFDGWKLGCNEWWVVGGIYSPNHQSDRWWGLLSHGRWVLTVGASDRWATGQSGGAPDSHCSLSGAPSDAYSDFCARSEHCSLFMYRCRRSLALGAVAPLGIPDSPVNNSGAASRILEAEQFGVELPGAPDTVRWCTRQSSAPDQGNLRVVFCSFYWFVVNLWHL